MSDAHYGDSHDEISNNYLIFSARADTARVQRQLLDANAEIERLNKALGQAIGLANIRVELRKATDDDDGEGVHYVCCDSCGTPFMSELAAELRKRQTDSEAE